MHLFLTVQPMQDGRVYNFHGHVITTRGGYFLAFGRRFPALKDAMRCVETEAAILDDVDKLMETALQSLSALSRR